MGRLVLLIIAAFFAVGCDREPTVDVEKLEEVETGPHGDIIQDD
ncbi:MAG: hypothetical protein K940chlam3_00565 [Chlamydiae bacterium]|nr:hypothetical protein [Chlamydiota bacterium]